MKFSNRSEENLMKLCCFLKLID